MSSWLTRLQAKPKGYRQRVAFLGALTFTAAVVAVWAVSLPERFSTISQAVDERPLEEERTTAFWSGLQNQFATVRSAVGGAFGAASSSNTPTAETEPAAATTSVRASGTPQVIMPTITPENARTLTPRRIQIATSSATGTSS